MKFSLFYFADDSTAHEGNRYELLLSGARFADQNGFAAIWTPEQHFHPLGGLYPNPAVTGAALAAITERIGIRAGSVKAPLHHPLRIAEEWAVVDNLSDGRVGISFTSGGNPIEFALRPQSFSEREMVMTEAVNSVRALWAGEYIPLMTGKDDPVMVRAFPPPVQAEIPVWLTCTGSAEAFRTAGRMETGVLTHLLGEEFDDLEYKVSEYRKASHEASGTPGHVTLVLPTLLGTDTDTVREAAREPFSRYLRNSFGRIARSLLGQDFRSIDELGSDNINFLLRRAFDLYFTTSGLFGTVEQAARIVEKARAIGVDEIACLIDFGVDTNTVLAGLEHLNILRKQFEAC